MMKHEQQTGRPAKISNFFGGIDFSRLNLYRSLIRTAILLAAVLPFFNIRAGEIRIDMKSDPPLPLKNLVGNGGFEKGLEGWTMAKSEDKGWEVKLSDESFSGAHSLYVKVTDEGKHRARGVFQSLGKAMGDGRMTKGRTYYLSCWVKAINASNIGGEYCGAGAALSFFDAVWKRSAVAQARGGDTSGGWEQLVSGPVKYEDWAGTAQVTAGISYSTGEMWIDDICVSEAALALNVEVNGGPFRQVLIKGDDDILFDSGRLAKETTSFSKSIEVSCRELFTVSVVGGDGTIVRKTLDGSSPSRALPEEKNPSTSPVNMEIK